MRTRTAADLHRRAEGRRDRRGADRPRTWACPSPPGRWTGWTPTSTSEGIAIKRSRIDEILLGEGLRWRHAGDLVRRAGRPRLRRKKGAIEQLYTAAAGGQRRRLPRRDGAGGGQELPRPAARPTPSRPPTARARQAGDRLRPARARATSSAPSGRPPARRSRAPTSAAPRPTGSTSWSRSRPGSDRRSSGSTRSLDNLQRPPRAPTCCCSRLAHPRWEFVFQPKYAAYLNLIEPWWKVLRSLALKGRRFETWEEIVPGGRGGDGLLERAPAPVRLGPAPAPPAAPPPGDRRRPKTHNDLADAPLRSGPATGAERGAGAVEGGNPSASEARHGAVRRPARPPWSKSPTQHQPLAAEGLAAGPARAASWRSCHLARGHGRVRRPRASPRCGSARRTTTSG